MDSNDADNLFIVDDEISEALVEPPRPWKVLIADDEPGIHAITKMVLRDLAFEGKKLEFIDAFSAAEVNEILAKQNDIAILLLDVVMETDQSGLEAAKFIRENLKNKSVRIILRTGQPGQAPERSVITTYDINDYKEKSELTSQKLFTTVMSALRSYRDIMTIEESKRGLENIIKASLPLFKMEKTIVKFASAVLDQLSSLLDSDRSFLSVKHMSFAAFGMNSHFEIISGTSKFSKFVNKDVSELRDAEIVSKVSEAVKSKTSLFFDHEFVGYFVSHLGFETILYLRTNHSISDLDKNLLQIFSTNITLAFDNMTLNQDIIETQKEIVFTIGDVVETRSKETANHVRRVVLYSVRLAELAGLSPDDIEVLQNASPLHDLGKIGIPDELLSKPRPLTTEEFEVMKTHTIIGYEILKRSKRRILQSAATIALEHHECWDGSGYPRGLKGEEPHIFSRITRVVDVFDALAQKRVYKEAWPIPEVRDYIEKGSGTLFDPRLTKLFLDNFDEFVEIMVANPE